MLSTTGAVCRLCRREGQKLFLKGTRCETVKCSVDRRGTPPGAHPWKRGRFSEFGQQLREKQKMKRFYGLRETPFRRAFAEADRKRGPTGDNLLKALELRLDNPGRRERDRRHCPHHHADHGYPGRGRL